ncbi:hypothetical protein [Streptomyces rubiginosohelvolus]|uniref:hypothetical protein n=1 Tax=Streptomyces rubiginosohelvolus TaxID=67362 RepID=UPI002F90B518|nr:hypothetical protein OG475_35110 [Streptomyces rubiginosohelvolus]
MAAAIPAKVRRPPRAPIPLRKGSGGSHIIPDTATEPDMPRPDKETRAAAKARIAELKKIRDKAHEEAEEAKATADEVMWKAIAAELDTGEALQLDAAEATDFSRDHVAKRTKQYRTTQD